VLAWSIVPRAVLALLLVACGAAPPHGAVSGSGPAATGIAAGMERAARSAGRAVTGRAECALREGEEERFHTVLDAARRYLVVAVGEGDAVLGLAIEDEHGQALARVEGPARDGLRVALAPRWTGPVLVRIRALRGSGPCGVQLFLAP
jgi:hypothetical protein